MFQAQPRPTDTKGKIAQTTVRIWRQLTDKQQTQLAQQIASLIRQHQMQNKLEEKPNENK